MISFCARLLLVAVVMLGLAVIGGTDGMMVMR